MGKRIQVAAATLVVAGSLGWLTWYSDKHPEKSPVRVLERVGRISQDRGAGPRLISHLGDGSLGRELPATIPSGGEESEAREPIDVAEPVKRPAMPPVEPEWAPTMESVNIPPPAALMPAMDPVNPAVAADDQRSDRMRILAFWHRMIAECGGTQCAPPASAELRTGLPIPMHPGCTYQGGPAYEVSRDRTVPIHTPIVPASPAGSRSGWFGSR